MQLFCAAGVKTVVTAQDGLSLASVVRNSIRSTLMAFETGMGLYALGLVLNTVPGVVDCQFCGGIYQGSSDGGRFQFGVLSLAILETERKASKGPGG